MICTWGWNKHLRAERKIQGKQGVRRGKTHIFLEPSRTVGGVENRLKVLLAGEGEGTNRKRRENIVSCHDRKKIRR